MQLRPKLLLAFVAVSAPPLVLLAVLLYHGTIRHTERLVGKRLQDNVLQAADAIDEYLLRRIEDIRLFGQTRLFAQADTADINAELRLRVAVLPRFTQLLYVGETGLVLAASDSAAVGKRVLDLYPSLAEEFQNALTHPPGMIYVSDLSDTVGMASERWLAPGSRWALDLELVTRVRARAGGQSPGVLVAVVNLDRIREILGNLDRRAPGSEHAFLLDSLGRILISDAPGVVPLSLHPMQASPGQGSPARGGTATTWSTVDLTRARSYAG